jgi:hypothetical protein
MMKKDAGKRRRIMTNIALLAGTLILLVLLLELTFYFAYGYFRRPTEPYPIGQARYTSAYSEASMVPDADLGQALKKNNTQQAAKYFYNGTEIFNVTYQIDDFGRRTVHQTYNKTNKNLILFGCSITFGSGLDSNQTLQYLLYRKLGNYNVYNYATPGYGTQQMHALLQENRIPTEITNASNTVIYVYIDDHVRRVSGSLSAFWTRDYPYYYIDNKGALAREGSFRTGRRATTKIYDSILSLENYDYFLKLINFDLPLRSHIQIELVHRLIHESKKISEKQLDADFYVLFHPESSNSDEAQQLKRILERDGIKTIDVKIEGYRVNYTILGDGHPTYPANLAIANEIVSRLNKDAEIRHT